MEKVHLLSICQKIAKYIVYNCEGEPYASQIVALGNARTRKTWIKEIHLLLHCGKAQSKEDISITQEEWNDLWAFIRDAPITEVRALHITMKKLIAEYEWKKIQEMERTVAKILLGLEAEGY
ncbi:hypothetical protein [Shimazuella kribbensis]|uniref:hypothetical protein n=1 Tax=Shimazuella kribbensis TaxID=139808 RepID=UPI000427252F|nr:hypothetical protein [Shimazuella kribbensis]